MRDALIVRAEADLRWLDLCEERLVTPQDPVRVRGVNDEPEPAQTRAHREGAGMIPILEFVDVVKSFGAGEAEVRAVTDVSLAIAPGEFVAVRGPSGCGKSTLLHLAGGLEDPSAGRVLVDGHDVNTLSPAARSSLRRRDVGYVFQRLNLVAGLTAVENVTLPLELDGVGRRAARAQRSTPCTRSVSTRVSTAIPTTSPAASSSESRSRARSSAPGA